MTLLHCISALDVDSDGDPCLGMKGSSGLLWDISISASVTVTLKNIKMGTGVANSATVNPVMFKVTMAPSSVSSGCSRVLPFTDSRRSWLSISVMTSHPDATACFLTVLPKDVACKLMFTLAFWRAVIWLLAKCSIPLHLRHNLVPIINAVSENGLSFVHVLAPFNCNNIKEPSIYSFGGSA